MLVTLYHGTSVPDWTLHHSVCLTDCLLAAAEYAGPWGAIHCVAVPVTVIYGAEYGVRSPDERHYPGDDGLHKQTLVFIDNFSNLAHWTLRLAAADVPVCTVIGRSARPASRLDYGAGWVRFGPGCPGKAFTTAQMAPFRCA